MEKRFNFTGNGGALLVRFLVGGLLTVITFGLYMPWFVVSLNKFMYTNTTLRGSPKGELRLEFRGTGGQLFVTYLVGVLLTVITFGIYGAWFAVKLIKFFADNSVAKAVDGTEYKLQFNGTGGQMFVTYLVGYLLTLVTLGIYGAWFAVKLMKFVAGNTVILENGARAGNIDFMATGGQLFVIVLVGYLLTLVTLGIYSAWFAVKLNKFFSENTEVTVNGARHVGSFGGTGGEFFVLNLVGYLLTLITFGIYGAWYTCRIWKFQINNTAYVPR